MKLVMSRTVLALCVVLASGCSRAEQSVVRRDYLLAADHGWVDLTVTLTTLTQHKDQLQCDVQLNYNGEIALGETIDLPSVQASKVPMGYRLPVPAGALDMEVRLSGCVKDALLVKLPLAMKKDHLAQLEFDGASLKLAAMAPYEPTSLESVRTQMQQLEAKGGESAQAAQAAVSTLTRIALGSLALNLLALMLIVWQWRGKRGGN